MAKSIYFHETVIIIPICDRILPLRSAMIIVLRGAILSVHPRFPRIAHSLSSWYTMNMSPFLLCNAPQLIINAVFDSLSIPQIFAFSLTSKKCRVVAKSSRVPVESLKWRVRNYVSEIEIQRRGHRRTVFTLEYCSLRPWMELEAALKAHLPPFGTYKGELDGRGIIVLDRTEPNKKYILCRPYIDPSRKDFIGIVSERLLDILHVETFHLIVENIDVSPWILNLNRHFTTFSFHCEWILTSEKLTCFMEDVYAEEFVIRSAVVDGFQYKRPLRHKRMTVNPAKWVSIDCLLSMECQRLELIDATLTSADMNSFFKTWQKGELPKLKYLKLADVQYGIEILEGVVHMVHEDFSSIKSMDGSVGKLNLSQLGLVFEVEN